MILLQCDGMSSWIQECPVCIPGKIGSLVSTIYTAILIAVPLILVLSGMFTMASSVMKQSEDEIKKAQKLLVKKLITGAIVFLLFALVRWLVSYFDNDLTTCFDALINYNKSTDVCEFKKKEDGTYVTDSDGNRVLTDESAARGCGVSTNNEFWDINNKCQAQGAAGAVRKDGKIVCYVKDYENCSCNDGDPFRYTESITHGSNCNCWCATQTWDSGKYVYNAGPGTCK